MRILALVPGGVSEQLLFFPTLQALRDKYPKAQIHAIVEPRARGVYELCPTVDLVLPFNFQESLSLADLGDLLGRMRDTYYDVVIALNDDPLLRFFLWLSGIPKRVGYAGKVSFFLTDVIPRKNEQYGAHVYTDLLQAFGLTANPPVPQVRLKKADLAWAETERADRLGSSDKDYILLFPGKGDYPADSWATIAKTFVEKRPELAVAVASTPLNSDRAAAIVADLPNIPILAPSSIGELAAAIAGASLLLCPDCAAMQLAVATQTPVVGLFGASDPSKRLPAEGPFRAVKSETGKVADITPETVVATVFPA